MPARQRLFMHRTVCCPCAAAVATAFSVADSAGQAAAITAATASASTQAAAADAKAAGQALAATAIQSVKQGVTDTFAASQVRRCTEPCVHVLFRAAVGLSPWYHRGATEWLGTAGGLRHFAKGNGPC